MSTTPDQHLPRAVGFGGLGATLSFAGLLHGCSVSEVGQPNWPALLPWLATMLISAALFVAGMDAHEARQPYPIHDQPAPVPPVVIPRQRGRHVAPRTRRPVLA